MPVRTVRCGVVWEAGGRRPGWPAVPDSGIFSGDDALDKRHRNGMEVRISWGQRHGMELCGPGPPMLPARSSTSLGKGPRGGHAWHGFAVVDFGVLQACCRPAAALK